jgi:hypothetical protein
MSEGFILSILEVVTTQSVTTMEGTFEHTSELLYL